MWTILCTGLFRPVSSLSSRGQTHQNCWLPSLCLLIWWVFLTFHLGLVSLSLCDADCCDVHSLSHTDGEDHRRTNISCISDQSCYDHWCCFIAPGASDQRGKGPVDITGPQLDFALVCVNMHVFIFFLRVFHVALTRSSCTLSLVHALMCLSLRTHLSSWTGGRLRPLMQLAGL